MTTKIKIHAHASPTERELAIGLRSSISGTLFVEIGEIYFPAYGWGDFVVPVLEWWMEQATRLILPGAEARNIFMDGPCSFSLCRGAKSDITSLILYGEKKTSLGQFSISYERYLAVLRGAGKSVLRDIDAKGHSGHGEVEGLRSRLAQLMQFESDIKRNGLL